MTLLLQLLIVHISALGHPPPLREYSTDLENLHDDHVLEREILSFVMLIHVQLVSSIKSLSILLSSGISNRCFTMSVRMEYNVQVATVG